MFLKERFQIIGDLAVSTFARVVGELQVFVLFWGFFC